MVKPEVDESGRSVRHDTVHPADKLKYDNKIEKKNELCFFCPSILTWIEMDFRMKRTLMYNSYLLGDLICILKQN